MNIYNNSSIELIDHTGSDQRVLDAARVSTGSSNKSKEQDEKLIRYLMKNKHETPFEKIVFEFKVKTPLFIARQIFRHRIGSFNEESGRYKKLDMNFFMPEKLRKQNKEGNKQGSSGFIDKEKNERFLSRIESLMNIAETLYEDMVEAEVANELARIVLPVAIYTQFYWTINFRSLMNFVSLRKDSHAQPEIQEIAIKLESLVKDKIPMTYKAFKDFILNEEVSHGK